MNYEAALSSQKEMLLRTPLRAIAVDAGEWETATAPWLLWCVRDELRPYFYGGLKPRAPHDEWIGTAASLLFLFRSDPAGEMALFFLRQCPLPLRADVLSQNGAATTVGKLADLPGPLHAGILEDLRCLLTLLLMEGISARRAAGNPAPSLDLRSAVWALGHPVKGGSAILANALKETLPPSSPVSSRGMAVPDSPLSLWGIPDRDSAAEWVHFDRATLAAALEQWSPDAEKQKAINGMLEVVLVKALANLLRGSGLEDVTCYFAAEVHLSDGGKWSPDGAIFFRDRRTGQCFLLVVEVDGMAHFQEISRGESPGLSDSPEAIVAVRRGWKELRLLRHAPEVEKRHRLLDNLREYPRAAMVALSAVDGQAGMLRSALREALGCCAVRGFSLEAIERNLAFCLEEGEGGGSLSLSAYWGRERIGGAKCNFSLPATQSRHKTHPNLVDWVYFSFSAAQRLTAAALPAAAVDAEEGLGSGVLRPRPRPGSAAALPPPAGPEESAAAFPSPAKVAVAAEGRPGHGIPLGRLGADCFYGAIAGQLWGEDCGAEGVREKLHRLCDGLPDGELCGALDREDTFCKLELGIPPLPTRDAALAFLAGPKGKGKFQEDVLNGPLGIPLAARAYGRAVVWSKSTNGVSSCRACTPDGTLESDLGRVVALAEDPRAILLDHDGKRWTALRRPSLGDGFPAQFPENLRTEFREILASLNQRCLCSAVAGQVEGTSPLFPGKILEDLFAYVYTGGWRRDPRISAEVVKAIEEIFSERQSTDLLEKQWGPLFVALCYHRDVVFSVECPIGEGCLPIPSSLIVGPMAAPLARVFMPPQGGKPLQRREDLAKYSQSEEPCCSEEWLEKTYEGQVFVGAYRGNGEMVCSPEELSRLISNRNSIRVSMIVSLIGQVNLGGGNIVSAMDWGWETMKGSTLSRKAVVAALPAPPQGGGNLLWALGEAAWGKDVSAISVNQLWTGIRTVAGEICKSIEDENWAGIPDYFRTGKKIALQCLRLYIAANGCIKTAFRGSLGCWAFPLVARFYHRPVVFCVATTGKQDIELALSLFAPFYSTSHRMSTERHLDLTSWEGFARLGAGEARPGHGAKIMAAYDGEDGRAISSAGELAAAVADPNAIRILASIHRGKRFQADPSLAPILWHPMEIQDVCSDLVHMILGGPADSAPAEE